MANIPPFFIVASARSGTTFLRLTLTSHPVVAIPPESRFVVKLYQGPEVARDDFLERLEANQAFRRWELPVERVRERLGPASTLPYADAIDATFMAYAESKGKASWGDKTPRYIEHIPLLARIFPTSRFIHVVRDGRNVALSYSNVDFGPSNLPRAARLWRKRVLAGIRDGRALPPGRYLEIRSEDLAKDPEGVARDICGFLGIGFDPLMFDEDERAKWVFKKAKQDYEPKVAGRSRMSDWRQDMPAHDVELFEAVAGDALEELGYERRFPHPGLAARARAAAGLAGAPVARLR